MPDRYMSTGVVTVVLSPDRFLLPPGTKDWRKLLPETAQRSFPCGLVPNA